MRNLFIYIATILTCILFLKSVDAAVVWDGGGAVQTYKNAIKFGTNEQIKVDSSNKLKLVDSSNNSIDLADRKALDIFHAQDFETTLTWSTGNNATFLTTGTLDGALFVETSSPLGKLRSFKYTAGSSSQNDWISSPAISLDLKQRGQFVGISFFYKWSGSVDVEFVVKCTAGDTAEFTSALDVVESASSSTRFSTSIFISSTCTEIKYGFHFINAPTNGDILIFDDVELSTNPFLYKNLIDKQTGRYNTLAGYGSTNTVIPYFTNEVELSGPSIVSIGNDSTNGFSVTALRDSVLVITFSGNFNTANSLGFSLNSSQLTTGLASITTADRLVYCDTPSGGVNSSCTASVKLSAGDVVRPHVQSATTFSTADRNHITFTAFAETEHVVTPAKSNMSDWVDNGAVTLKGESSDPTKGTMAQDSLKWRRVGDTMELTWYYHQTSASGNSGSGDYYIDLNTELGVTIDSAKLTSGMTADIVNGDAVGVAILANTAAEATSNSFNAVVKWGGGNKIKVTSSSSVSTKYNWASDHVNVGGNSVVLMVAKFAVPIEGWTSNAQFLAAIPFKSVEYCASSDASGNITEDLWGDWISGNASVSDTSLYTITINPIFDTTQAVYCNATVLNSVDATSIGIQIQSQSSTSVVFRTRRTTTESKDTGSGFNFCCKGKLKR